MIYNILSPEQVRMIGKQVVTNLQVKHANIWGKTLNQPNVRISDHLIYEEIEDFYSHNFNLYKGLADKCGDYGYLNKDMVLNYVNRFIGKEKEGNHCELFIDL